MSFERTVKINKLLTGREITREFYNDSEKLGKATSSFISVVNEFPRDTRVSSIMAHFTMLFNILSKSEKGKMLYLLQSTFFSESGAKELNLMMKNMDYLLKNIDEEEK